MSEKLDEQGLQVARDAVKSAAAYNPMGDISTVADVAIRAYLQTAAADVIGLVDRLANRARTKNGAGEGAYDVGYYEAGAAADDREAASTLQTLSARNAALEAENERLRADRDKWKASAEGWQKIAAPKADAFGTRELLHDAMDRFARTEAALSAPKGGQDHG